jgi:rfaE bifunctional protein kinase chain/domain
MTDPQSLPTTDRLLEIIELMDGQPILMLVDLVVDRFITGTPKRISREAPVLILTHESEGMIPGGGANAVANVAALDGLPLTLGVVGDDESGRQLVEMLRCSGIDTSGIIERRGFRTPTKTRILGGGHHSIKQQIVRYDIEDKIELAEIEIQQFERQIDRWKTRATVAVLSDYGYGAVSPSLLSRMRQALGTDGTVLCDSRYRLGDFVGLDGATPNEEEAQDLLGSPISETEEQLLAAGSILVDSLSARFLLITRGSYGMSLFVDGSCCQIPVHGTDEVADVTGAGDTVIGTFGLALASGASPLEASLLADYAGGVVVMKRGTATLDRRELSEAVISDPRPLEESKWAKL